MSELPCVYDGVRYIYHSITYKSVVEECLHSSSAFMPQTFVGIKTTAVSFSMIKCVQCKLDIAGNYIIT